MVPTGRRLRRPMTGSDQTSDAQLRIGGSRSSISRHRDSGFALRAPRNDDDNVYRTSSFIAPSRPSMVIGYMRSENSRRMMVVDSE